MENFDYMCIYCGREKIRGERAERHYNRALSDGMTHEEAMEYSSMPGSYECNCGGGKNITPLVPLEELIHGAYYRGSCRNASLARWNAETQQFVYIREKFGHKFPEEIGYWIDAKPGEFRFDEFKPYGRVENPPFEIPLTI